VFFVDGTNAALRGKIEKTSVLIHGGGLPDFISLCTEAHMMYFRPGPGSRSAKLSEFHKGVIAEQCAPLSLAE
jgi:hypothetical protein